MKLPCHGITRDAFDALAVGGGGLRAVRELAAAQYSKHVVLLHGVLAAAHKADPEQYRLARDGWDLLTAALSYDSAAARQVIRHPAVGAWALRTIRACRGESAMPGAEPGGLGAVAAAAAIRAKLPAKIELGAAGGTVMLPSLGAATVAAPTAVVTIHADYAEISSPGSRVEIPADPHWDAPGWIALRRVSIGSLSVLIDDLDPYRMPTSHNVAPRLSADDFRRWRTVLQTTWPEFALQHSAVAAEVAAATVEFVPLNRPASGQVSSSSAEAFGAIAMSEPPDPDTCAVTLAHEVQHLKLDALLEIVPLIMPDDGRRYYAPWREDPRPISGLLQGAYAYLGVSGFWRRQRQLTSGVRRLRADREFARWREAAAQAVETLRSSGRLTPVGMNFVQVMKRTLADWRDEPVSAEAEAQARHEAELHLASWQAKHGPLPG